MQFVGCQSFTVGAEWELQLLDRQSLDLTPGISALLEEFGSNSRVKPELIQSCVEINTPICSNSGDLAAHLSETLCDVIDACGNHGMILAGSGTHPFCRRLAIITKLPRFKTSVAEHGYIAQSQLAFATHIHIGIGSGDEAMRIMRYLTPCLPVLIAVSANSPFWRGHNTGYACYRRRLLSAARSYGIPPCFSGWSDFKAFFRMARRAGSVKTIKDVHWDIRPHPDFGTVEVRVMDAQSNAADVAFIAGVVRVLVAWISRSSREEIESVIPRALSTWIDRENHYRASHWGMDASLIAAKSGRTRPLLSYICALAEATKAIAAEIDESTVPDRLVEMRPVQGGYERQRQAFSTRDDILDVVRFLTQQIGIFSGRHSISKRITP